MSNDTQNECSGMDLNEIIIDTGNLLTCEELKRKASILPSDEIVEGITLMLKNWKQNTNNLKIIKNDNCVLICSANDVPELNIERQSIKITVKVFTYDLNDCDALIEAVNVVIKQLNITSIDSLILSLPLSSQKLSLDQIKSLWKCAEEMVINGRIASLGISDLDSNQLIQLYEWSQLTKPSINQINLEACCVIPPDMSAYAKEHNIQLLTHNDPKDFLPIEMLHSMLQSNTCINDPIPWKRYWIVRYSSIVIGKGILKNKGYILATKK